MSQTEWQDARAKSFGLESEMIGGGGTQTGLRDWTRRTVVATAFCATCLVGTHAFARESSESRPPASPARRVFVDAFDGKHGTEQLRDAVIAHLRASREVRIVEKAQDADLIVRGDGEMWLKGYVAVSPRSTASVRQAIFGGYLSLRVQDRSGEELWSYLVTPGHVHWNGADDDMAGHIVRRMLAALETTASPSDRSAAQLSGKASVAGAGSTFAAPLYQAWAESYAARRPGFRSTYQAVGSENGVRLLEEGKVDFAASDVPVSEDRLAAMAVKVRQYATVLGGVVPAYNLPGVSRDLEFTPELLAGIYLGRITRWNDPAMRAANRGVTLPDAPVLVLHRSDGSGTSFAFTDYLSKTSQEWKAKVGTGMRVPWPVGEGVEGNEGIAERIVATPGAIGYLELTYAIRHELNYGLVRNAAGRFIQANLAALGEAASSQASGGDLRASLVNAPGKNAYPITTFTWILVTDLPRSDPKAAAMTEWLEWMLTTGQKECSGLGYVPLPKSVAEGQLARVRAQSPGTAAISGDVVPPLSPGRD